jgi:hypothetical protein
MVAERINTNYMPSTMHAILALWALFRTPLSIQQATSQCAGMDAELAKAALQWLPDALFLTL